jgi:hypothetical protein
LVVNGPLVYRDYLFKMHSEHFAKKEGKPDLIICDLFSGEAMEYAAKN